jgi:hypothetical protein
VWSDGGELVAVGGSRPRAVLAVLLLDVGRVVGVDRLVAAERGRMVAVGGRKAPAFFVFAAPQLTYDRYDTARQKEILRDAYRGGGWRIPELMARVPGRATISRKGNAGPFLAPRSRTRMALRNATFRSRLLLGLMMRMTDRFATDIDLPDYPEP